MTTKIEVPCSGCSTDPCYHWPYCTELLSLRAENERLRALLQRFYEWDHMDGAGDGPYWRDEIDKALGRHNY